MKKVKFLALLLLVSIIILTGCTSINGNSKPTQTGGETPEENLSAILLIPGVLGDKSFFDSAYNGLKMIEEQYGATVRVVEMTGDFTKWEPNFMDAVEGDWDIIFSGSDTSEMLYNYSLMYPDQKFINFDSNMSDAAPNLYSMEYKANELSFLAGAVAALVTESDMELANDDALIGFLGGMDIPGINDFLVGYIEGAKYINPDIKVMVSYAGVFTDPPKGKELGILQYNSGVDISFNVAGGTGLGLLDAAKEQNKYAIGVDSDQAVMFEETDPDKSPHILTSAIKKIDYAMLDAVEKHLDGTLEYGVNVRVGLAEGAVGLAKNVYYEQLSESDRAIIDELEDKLAKGEIKVGTAYGLTAEEMNVIRDAVKP